MGAVARVSPQLVAERPPNWAPLDVQQLVHIFIRMGVRNKYHANPKINPTA